MHSGEPPQKKPRILEGVTLKDTTGIQQQENEAVPVDPKEVIKIKCYNLDSTAVDHSLEMVKIFSAAMKNCSNEEAKVADADVEGETTLSQFRKFLTDNRMKHPLEFPTIVESVMAVAETKSVQESKLVNKLWRSEAQREIQKRGLEQVTIEEGKLASFLTKWKYAAGEPVQTKFKVILGQESRDMRDFKTFLSRFGETIKYLELNNRHRMSDKYEAEFTTIIKRTLGLPKLETFVLNTQACPNELVVNDEEIGRAENSRVKSVDLRNMKFGEITNFLKGILSLVPKTTTLTISSLAFQNQSVSTSAFVSAFKFLELTSFYSATCYFEPSFWTKFQSQKLIQCTIDVVLRSESDKVGIEKFLGSQLKLKYLTLKNTQIVSDVSNLKMPVMSELKALSLVFEGSSFPMKPIKSVKLPIVKSICLGNDRGIFITEMLRVLNPKSPFDSTTELGRVLNGKTDRGNINVHFNMAAMNLVGRLFPVLRRLANMTLVVDQADLESIFENLSQLEELDVEVLVKNTFLMNDILGGKRKESAQTQPRGLQGMRALKRLELDFVLHHRDAEYKLEGDGIEEGLLKIKPLIKLRLGGQFTISQEDSLKLVQHHINVQILPQNS